MEDHPSIPQAREQLRAGRSIEAMTILMEAWRTAPGAEPLRVEFARVAREMKSLRHKQVLYQDIGEGDPRFGKAVDERYLIIQRVSESPGVSIYRAWDEKDGSERILWFFEPLWRGSDLRQGTVLAELARIHAFAHPFAIEMKGFGAPTDDEAYAAFTPPSGRTLSKALAEGGPIPPEMARPAIAALLDGLAAAHAAGIFHGNLRPDHVAGFDEEPKVLDLGLYSLIRALFKARKMTRTGQIPGLLAYLPPEYERAEPPDAPWDIYTAGAVAFEVLTGSPPYGHPEPRQPRSFLMRMKDGETPKARSTAAGAALPGWTDDLLGRMIARDPAARFESAAAAAAAWRSSP